MEAMTIPSMTALAMDFPYFNGLRFCKGILDMDKVSMTTRVQIVRSERTSGFSVSPGKYPPKFVINATAMAAIIINALLVSRVTAFMYHRCQSPYLSIIDK